MKILVLENDNHDFHLLKHLLEDIRPEAEIIGPISTVEQAKDYLQYCHYGIDIIITDIRLNDGLCFDALNHAPEDTPVIFTTTYGDHALQAFGYNSLSYLLKPIDSETLSQALDKARKLLRPHRKRQVSSTAGESSYRERFLVKSTKGEKVILIANIRYIVSEQKTTYIKLQDGTSYALPKTLDEVAGMLNPKFFMRVDRKYIIPLGQVAGTERLENGKMSICLKGDSHPEIIVSRTRKAEVCKWLAGK
ncbi:response regulator transcription factor [Palleniella muris]|uniref:Response regulator transcription factor n=1 Tax=Palleniella muris TaxID=3038145 RepID=A0AC61QRL0_9BACT|nr:LytTR family DNA-binding domain-containing protein [Palleniella muris]TGX83056.1 response regulator transcription factor [Palleniella muris]